jgi:hypothetical protein
LVNLDIERKRYVVTEDLEVLSLCQMEDILAASGIKIVDANDVAILFDQALT